jgi:hypothetical protein
MRQRIRSAAWAAGLVACAAGTAWADAIPVFDTGVDADGKTVAVGTADAHWQIVQVPAGSSFAPTAAAIVAAAHPGYVQNDAAGQPGSRWIAPGGDTDAFYPLGVYVYRTTFDLSGFVAATASISGALGSDDGLEDVLVNGVSLGIRGGGPSNMNTTFTIASGFVDGVNTLDFVVRNAGRAPGPHGLRVRLDGTADPSAPADETAPVLAGLADVTLEVTGSALALDAAALGISATDAVDGAVAVALSPASVLALGDHVVTATATDAAGNVATGTFTVSVVDTTAPVVTSIGVTAESMRGRSGTMVQLTLAVQAVDAGDPAPTSRIVAVSGGSERRRHGRGRRSSGSEITGDLTVVLKTDRWSRWTGRTFEITVETSDASGNVTTTVVPYSASDAPRGRDGDDDDDRDGCDRDDDDRDDDDHDHDHDRDDDDDRDHDDD